MIAVTGATGLLGTSIVRRLAEANHPVVAIKRSNSDTSLLADVKGNIIFRDADVEDVVSLREALQDVSTVIHAAAVVSFNPRDKKKIFNTNVVGTQNVVDVCLDQNIEKLIHISSVAAIGRIKGAYEIDENQKWIESPYHSAYAQSKYLAELEVTRGHEEGLTTTILNPSVILGPGDWNKSSSKLFKYIWKERPFYIDGHLNYVSLRDVVNVVEQLLSTSHNGQRFIVNAGTISYNELFGFIAKNFNKNKPSLKIKGRLVSIVAWLSTAVSNLTGTDPLITKELARATAQSVFFDNKKVKSMLNFEFEPLEETLEWCCKHYITAAEQ